MDNETKAVFQWIIAIGEVERYIAVLLTEARREGVSLPRILRQYVVNEVRDLPSLQYDIGVSGQDLETIVDWDIIVRKIEYRQNLNEMAYI